MEAARTVWSDVRLDGLNGKVDELRAESAALRSEMCELRVEMNARFDSLQRSMITMMGTMALGFAGIVATQP